MTCKQHLAQKNGLHGCSRGCQPRRAPPTPYAQSCPSQLRQLSVYTQAPRGTAPAHTRQPVKEGSGGSVSDSTTPLRRSPPFATDTASSGQRVRINTHLQLHTASLRWAPLGSLLPKLSFGARCVLWTRLTVRGRRLLARRAEVQQPCGNAGD